LKLARLAWEHLNLDELRFIPTFINPKKRAATAAPDTRLAMLRQMLIGAPFAIDDVELKLGGVSYTADTLETLIKRESDAAWILVMGSDQISDFPNWRNPARILELASVSIAARPDRQSAVKDSKGEDCAELPGVLSERVRGEWSGLPGQIIILPSTNLELSSSQIRDQLAYGKEPIGISEQVRAVISQEKLYC
jgi:nicotinate-nucleotide adenylyltransferase